MSITPDLGSILMLPQRYGFRAAVPAMMAQVPRQCLTMTRDGRRDSEEGSGVA